MAEEKVEELVSESLTIAVVKKNIFDIVLRALKREDIEVNGQLIIELIDKIPIGMFREVGKRREDKDGYSKQIEEIVKVIIQEYLKAI